MRVFFACVVLVLSSCLGVVSDVLPRPDSGSPQTDGGFTFDAGLDGSVAIADAGDADAGGFDAGSAGDAAVPDAGVPAVDAGPYGYDSRPANPTCVAHAPPPTSTGVKTTRVFPNLAFNAPLGLYQAPGDPTVLFVQERDGVIKRFPNSQTAKAADVTTVLDFHTKVSTGGSEGGFLGMAFHPQWPTKNEVFLSYTEPGTGSSPLRSVIARYKSNDQGLTLDPASEERILQVDQPYANHDGGNIAFGPDGYLYIGFGDGGSGGDPHDNGQSLRTIMGKMLRIDVNVPFAQKYAIPPSNPWASTGVSCNVSSTEWDGPSMRICAEIWAYGLRNPWRWAFDPVSGELWLADVGQNAYEEVDRIEKGGNYGWNTKEGFHCYSPSSGCSSAGLIDPLVEYAHDSNGGNVVTGGFVYRGTLIPTLVGKFIYGDEGNGRIWAVTTDSAGKYQGALLVDSGYLIGSFAQTFDGEVYALDIATGVIAQLTPSGALPPDTFPQLLSETGCFDASDPKKPVAGLIPYDLNATLWSDGATKERYFAVPDGQKIHVNADGDFVFPNGTVMVKTFLLDGKRVETRLLMRHSDGTWAGYSYEWNDTETEATLLPGAKSKSVGTHTWNYPSRAQCLTCHTDVAGRTLGPEIGQFNRTYTYPTGRARNELETLAGLGYFDAALPGAVNTLQRLEAPFGSGSLELRARAYLHANCSGCHRNGAGQGPADFRYSLATHDIGVCNANPTAGDLGVTGAKLLTPGMPSMSIVSLRMHALDSSRMPRLGSIVVDPQGTALVDQWVSSLTTCP